MHSVALWTILVWRQRGAFQRRRPLYAHTCPTEGQGRKRKIQENMCPAVLGPGDKRRTHRALLLDVPTLMANGGLTKEMLVVIKDVRADMVQ